MYAVTWAPALGARAPHLPLEVLILGPLGFPGGLPSALGLAGAPGL